VDRQQHYEQGQRALADWRSTHARQSLDAAVEAFRATLALPWNGTERPQPAECAQGMVTALTEGSEADLAGYTDEAINVTSQLLERVATVPWLWTSRGYNRMLRYKRQGSLGDLDGAVADFEQALAETPAGDPHIYRRAVNMSWASEERFDRLLARGEQFVIVEMDGIERWRGPRDLVSPITLLELLLAADNGRPPASGQEVPEIKRNLANLLTKYALFVEARAHQDRVADLSRAVRLLQEAMTETVPGSFEHNSIAQSLVANVEKGGDELGVTGPDLGVDAGLLRQAVDVVAATEDSTAEPSQRAVHEFNRAGLLIRLGQAEEAMEAYRRLALSPAGGRVPPSVGADSARIWANHAFGREAWDEVIQAERAGIPHLDALRSSSLDLFSRDAYSAQRGRSATQAAFAWAKQGSIRSARSVLEAGRNSMLAERMGVGLPAGRGSPAGSTRPVIFLLTTYAGGVALPGGDAAPVWLDRLGGAAFEDRQRAYAAALDAVRGTSVLGLCAWISEVAAMVAFLEEALAPLFAAFPEADLTLVPTGALTLLPVGAAALTARAPRRSVSTVPSSGLSGGGSQAGKADRVLAIADPALPSTRWESRGVRAFFSESCAGPPDASAAGILAALPAGGVAHFACHARADPGRPLHNAILLPGGDQLTVAEILGASPPAGTTVILSACETGLAGPHVLDETISLSAALLAAGCSGVLSTLWLVEDVSTALLMLKFYWEWRRERHPAPLALALAQHWQRTTSDREKCSFAEDTLAGFGILDEAEGRALADRVRQDSDSPSGNSYAEPYYWAGFCFSGQ
jgi:tetratricopeptide (TPR) repeat protein